MKLDLTDNQVDKYFNKARELEKTLQCKNCKTNTMIFEPVHDVFVCANCKTKQKIEELESFIKN